MTRHHINELYNRRAEAMMPGINVAVVPFPSQVRLLELADILARQYRSPPVAVPAISLRIEQWR